uniref:Neurotransmitter-gated ion-channel ligand-binding domain-containing protein n=1 Tax=Plectus sambesii TaxID=2011161 RepID=A0A914W6L9_9BILA
MLDFPYDTQQCTLSYTSWNYNADEIDVTATVPIDLGVYMESNEWTLRNYTVERSEYTADGDRYANVDYTIKITRKPSYYVNTFVSPTFLITCLSIIGVFSPFNEVGGREERVTLGLTTLLTMAVVLMIVADQMPKSSTGMPRLGLFVMAEIGISVLMDEKRTCARQSFSKNKSFGCKKERYRELFVIKFEHDCFRQQSQNEIVQQQQRFRTG